MPNYCSCTVRIRGDDRSMAEFYKTLDLPDACGDSADFSFHQTVPEEEPSIDGHCRTWGTKWDAISPEVHVRDPTEFFVKFETAWSPPIAWAKQFSTMCFPDLELCLAYCECGMAYYGVWRAHQCRGLKEDRQYNFAKDSVDWDQEDDNGDQDDNGDHDAPPTWTTIRDPHLKKFLIKYQVRQLGG